MTTMDQVLHWMKRLYRKMTQIGTVDFLLEALSSTKKELSENHLYVSSSCAACNFLLSNPEHKAKSIIAILNIRILTALSFWK